MYAKDGVKPQATDKALESDPSQQQAPLSPRKPLKYPTGACYILPYPP